MNARKLFRVGVFGGTTGTALWVIGRSHRGGIVLRRSG